MPTSSANEYSVRCLVSTPLSVLPDLPFKDVSTIKDDPRERLTAFQWMRAYRISLHVTRFLVLHKRERFSTVDFERYMERA